jgi:hypothetical protein
LRSGGLDRSGPSVGDSHRYPRGGHHRPPGPAGIRTQPGLGCLVAVTEGGGGGKVPSRPKPCRYAPGVDRLVVGYATGAVLAILTLCFLRIAFQSETDRQTALHEYRSAKNSRANPHGLVLLHLAASRAMALFGASLCLLFLALLFWPT